MSDTPTTNTSNGALTATYLWFMKCFPKPKPQNVTTQMGVHFEEVSEMISEIVPKDPDTNEALLSAKEAIQHLADHLKRNSDCVEVPEENRQPFLDSLCDQIVTAVGCGYMHKMDIVGGMLETNRENYSKFDENNEPIFDENGKVIKGPNYIRSDLSNFV